MENIILTVTVLGEPITKSNSTFITRRGAFIPDKFVVYEKAIEDAAIESLKQSGLTIFTQGPVEIEIKYYLGANRKKDLTNLPKTTCDALSDVFYTDDSQIVKATMEKFFDKQNPRVEILVKRPVNWQQNQLNKVWSFPPGLRVGAPIRPPKPKKAIKAIKPKRKRVRRKAAKKAKPR